MKKIKKFFSDFKAFISKGNVVDMAIGVIVASAFTAIVTALTNGIIMPFINWLLALGGAGLDSAYTFLKKVTLPDGTVDLANSITQEQREEMHRLQNMEPFEVVNVSYNSDTEFKKEEGYLTHLIGVLTTEKEIGAGLETLPMKAGTWAVFPNEGEFPSTLQNTMARIYAEWFMTADYELAESLSFSFTKMNPDRQGHAYSEIWIPVVKKER